MTKPTVSVRATNLGPTEPVGNPSPNAAIHVLLVGNADRPEAAWAIPPRKRRPSIAVSGPERSLRARVGPGVSVCWQQTADLPTAIRLIEAGAPIPDVVVLIQPYPSCIEQKSVEDFRRQFPLVRLVSLAGSWCEGESRSGRPLNGVFRIPWHRWPHQQDEQLAALTDTQSGPLALPPTATPDEHLLARAARPRRRLTGAVGIASIEQARAVLAQHNGKLAPRSNSWPVRWTETDAPPSPGQAACRLLHDACAARGATGVFLRAEPAATASPRATEEDVGEKVPTHRPARCPRLLRGVFVEAAPLDGQARSLVAQLASAVAPAPLAVLANFPRIDQAAAAVAVGAAAVMAKPFDLDDLFAWLEQVGRDLPSDSGVESQPGSILQGGA